MCGACLAEELHDHGRPIVVEADHLAVGVLIRKLHAAEWGSVGGPLHIITDDTNVDDHSLDYCEGVVHDRSHWADDAMTDDDRGLCLDIIAGLRALPSEADRAAAVEFADFPGPNVGTMVIPTVCQGHRGFVYGSRWPR